MILSGFLLSFLQTTASQVGHSEKEQLLRFLDALTSIYSTYGMLRPRDVKTVGCYLFSERYNQPLSDFNLLCHKFQRGVGVTKFGQRKGS